MKLSHRVLDVVRGATLVASIAVTGCGATAAQSSASPGPKPSAPQPVLAQTTPPVVAPPPPVQQPIEQPIEQSNVPDYAAACGRG